MLYHLTGFHSFLRLNIIHLCILHILFIHSFFSGHLGCFHLSAIMNNTAINVGVPISLQDPAFNSFGHIPRSGITGSQGNSFFWGTAILFFHSGYAILHSHQQCIRVPIPPTLVIFCFFDNSHPNGCEVVTPCCYSLICSGCIIFHCMSVSYVPCSTA